ncbi:NADPH-dependent F420 reductase [Nocardia sp. NPDC049149]|uniref:NADPH-dependent F420 reductase n=1 Tax=Nocardia sp. NPDC049149 TaxID=3364315 RepID=UPI0037192C30
MPTVALVQHRLHERALMRIVILGTGTMANALGTAWARAGHEITIAGRSLTKARNLAAQLGGTATTVPEAIVDVDAVLLAIAWSGVPDILGATHATTGTLTGTTLIDPTNAIDHGIGTHLLPPDTSAAQHIAHLAPGSHVVKAFHLYPADQWTDPTRPPVTVPYCGDNPQSLTTTATLIRDTGSTPAPYGPLTRARQLEEAAGFIITLAFKGQNPRAAVPHIPTA